MNLDEQFTAAAEELSPTLYRVCVSILHQPQDAQDAVQETLVKAWARRHTLRQDTMRAYLVRIAVNECRNIQRRRMRQSPVETLPDEGVPPQERDLDLRRRIDALPETLRLPILLYYMEGWSDRMIAAALGTTAVAVRSRLSRARKKLKHMIELEQPEGERHAATQSEP